MSSPETERHLPSLDGIRAISIGLVIISHLFWHLSVPAEWKSYVALFDGSLGVLIFFCISGFLITYLLLQEAATHRLSLKLFYMRRSIRIVPASYTYIAVLFVLTALGTLHLSGCQFLTALTFTKNYACGDNIDGHLWSLSVEEQFYLLWPWIVANSKRATAIRIALALCVIAPISRGLEYHFTGPTLFWLTSHMDALMIGALLAYAATFASKELEQFLARYTMQMRLACVAAMLVPIELRAHLMLGRITVTVGPTIQALSATYLIGSVLYCRRGISYKILNYSAVAWVGVLSYSLYIWQEIFFVAFPIPFPINVASVFATAALSYYAIERPLVKLRKRLHAA